VLWPAVLLPGQGTPRHSATADNPRTPPSVSSHRSQHQLFCLPRTPNAGHAAAEKLTEISLHEREFIPQQKLSALGV